MIMKTICFVLSLLSLLFSSYTDLKHGKVYWWATLPLIGAGLIAQLFFLNAVDYISRVVLIVAVYFLYEGFIGGGDAKLVMMLSILNGVLAALVSLGLGTLIVLGVEFLKDKEKTKNAVSEGLQTLRFQGIAGIKKLTGKGIPLAPFMTISFVLFSCLFGLH